MQFISEQQIIDHFSRFKTGDQVILLRTISSKSGKSITAPIPCCIKKIQFANAKDRKKLPKYRKQDIDRISIDPDLLQYHLQTEDRHIRVTAFAYELEYTSQAANLTADTCRILYKKKQKDFRKQLKIRHDKRLYKSLLCTAVTAALCIYASICVFQIKTIGADILMTILSVIIILTVFAINNRNIQKVHLH